MTLFPNLFNERPLLIICYVLYSTGIVFTVGGGVQFVVCSKHVCFHFILSLTLFIQKNL